MLSSQYKMKNKNLKKKKQGGEIISSHLIFGGITKLSWRSKEVGTRRNGFDTNY